ncbi:Na+/H+ antiporter NhaA [Veronia pacifica]|uniref:Na(+)/H(+) antiporter NhaA n=1 Tax=Veronia pacifica TaxID=1080227 RepID=A0A1C3EK15_9GAMM|nr:Na+/H+ antiporter NhaA [Veronia pacifica]ODA33576.1 Na(+)/H(+) antiporter NhaA [Veronia pacifica]
MTDAIRQFMKVESAAGIVLIVAALLAMLVANSPFEPIYEATLHHYILGLSIEHWISDFLMAIFFLLIGLEVKRELIEGALNTQEKAIFPAIAAIGGMLAPALIYLLFNFDNPVTVSGWAIPAATDIAFALGVMALLGNRVPLALKVFLLALAIIDDLGVIIIIALFYSSELAVVSLSIAFAATAVLFLLNYFNVRSIRWYLLVGAVLWVSVYQSGVHATLAGVVLGFTIPLRGKNEEDKSPLKTLEHKLHPYSSFLILPLFAFASAGVSLEGVTLSSLTHALPLGIALGLLVGKPLGIFVFSWVAVKTGIAQLPERVTFKQIFAVSILCGIGFTMSMFISALAFVGVEDSYITLSRLGILIGSTVSAVIGYLMLRQVLPDEAEVLAQNDEKDAGTDY